MGFTSMVWKASNAVGFNFGEGCVVARFCSADEATKPNAGYIKDNNLNTKEELDKTLVAKDD